MQPALHKNSDLVFYGLHTRGDQPAVHATSGTGSFYVAYSRSGREHGEGSRLQRRGIGVAFREGRDLVCSISATKFDHP